MANLALQKFRPGSSFLPSSSLRPEMESRLMSCKWTPKTSQELQMLSSVTTNCQVNSDCHEFRFSIVISVSNVTSLQDWLFNCQNCQKLSQLCQLSKLSKIIKKCQIVQNWLNFPKLLKLSKIVENCQNFKKNVKIVKIVKVVKIVNFFQNCQKLSENFSDVLFQPMTDRSEVNKIVFECQSVKSWLSQWVSQLVTRPPIELFWAANNTCIVPKWVPFRISVSFGGPFFWLWVPLFVQSLRFLHLTKECKKSCESSYLLLTI